MRDRQEGGKEEERERASTYWRQAKTRREWRKKEEKDRRKQGWRKTGREKQIIIMKKSGKKG